MGQIDLSGCTALGVQLACDLERAVELGDERPERGEACFGDDGLVEGDLDGEGGLDDERAVFGRRHACVAADLGGERGVSAGGRGRRGRGIGHSRVIGEISGMIGRG